MRAFLRLSLLFMASLPFYSYAESNAPEGGVGFSLQPYQGWIVVAAILPGSPAANAGLQPGDALLSVDGRAINGLSFEALLGIIRGKVGSKVTLTISRQGSMPHDFVVTRALISNPGAEPALPSSASPPVTTTPLQPSGPAVSGTVKFSRGVVRDPAAENREAFVFPLPDGWQSEGQIVWQHDRSILTNILVKVSDPKTGTAIEYLPCENFIWFPPMYSIQPGQNYQGKIYLSPVTDPAQFIQVFWSPQSLSHLRGLRPVRVQELPGLSAEFLRQFGGPGEAHAYRLRYEYDRQGQRWEEDVQLGLLFAGSQQLMSWYVNYAVAVRAPKGQLDRQMPIISAVLGNAKSPPEWAAYRQIVLRHFYQGQNQQIRDTAAFAQKASQYRAEMDEIRRQVVEDRMASQDRIAGYRREILGGVETYQDPYQNERVELPAGYKDYWVNDRGEYLMSEQTGFDPNQGTTANWKRLERKEPGRR
jgi:hypothetical protein